MQNLKFIQQFFFLTLVALSPVTITSQVVVGTGTPDASAAFEIQGTDRGLLLPRLTTDQRNGITSPATGLMIFNISTVCLEINIGTPAVPEWLQSGCRTGRVASIDCGGIGLSGNTVA